MKKWLSILFASLLILLTFSACAGQSSEPYTYTCNYNNQELLLTVDPANNTISDGVNTYTYEIRDTNIEIIYPNGATYWYSNVNGGNVSSGWSKDYDSELYLSGFVLEGALGELPTATPRSTNFVLILLCLLVGIIMLSYPRIAWYCTHGWMYQNAEPSNAALISARISGAVLLVLALVLLVL